MIQWIYCVIQREDSWWTVIMKAVKGNQFGFNWVCWMESWEALCVLVCLGRVCVQLVCVCVPVTCWLMLKLSRGTFSLNQKRFPPSLVFFVFSHASNALASNISTAIGLIVKVFGAYVKKLANKQGSNQDETWLTQAGLQEIQEQKTQGANTVTPVNRHWQT